MQPTPRSTFFAALRAVSPILLGAFPFAAVTGIAAMESHLSIPEAFGMSFIVFAGASQLIALQLLSAIPPAPVLIVIASAVIVNLRFMMYSASIAPYIKEASTRWKMLLAYMLSDQAYAVTITKFLGTPDMPHRQWYLFGTTFAMWLTWQIGHAVGVFLGAQVPRYWSLDFMIPLSFMALMVPTLKDRASGAAALAAGITAVVAFAMPFRLGMLTAVFIGIMVGLIVEAQQKKVEA